MGPFPTLLGGTKYTCTWLDGKSSLNYTAFLKNKTAGIVLASFKAYHTQAKRQTEEKHKVRILTDYGGEYCDAVFDEYCQENGIIHRTTAPYTPSQQNG